MVNTRLTETKR